MLMSLFGLNDNMSKITLWVILIVLLLIGLIVYLSIDEYRNKKALKDSAQMKIAEDLIKK